MKNGHHQFPGGDEVTSSFWNQNQIVHLSFLSSLPPSFLPLSISFFGRFSVMKPRRSLLSLIRSQWSRETQSKIHSLPLKASSHCSTSTSSLADTKTSAEEDGHLLPLSLHLATNRGDSRLCSGQAATAHLICKDWHPDDDFGGVIYSWQNPLLIYGRAELDSNIRCPADNSNSASATPSWFILRPWELVSHLSWCCPY